jgi:hypothetical protein
MSRPSLRVGSTLLIVGFIAFSFGLLIALHQTIIVEDIMSVIPDVGVVEVIGVLLQVFGPVLVVTGLLMSISSIVEIKLEDERRSLIEFTASVERTLNALASQMTKKTQASETAQKCKYCGAGLIEGDIFCPVCNRSQR